MTCEHFKSGCNAPESECVGLCMPQPRAELHPIMAAALAPWTPRTPEEEARWLSADVAEATEKLRPDYEQLRADRIQRRDADFVRVSTGAGMPGDKL